MENLAAMNDNVEDKPPLRIGFVTEWFDPEPAPIPGLALASWLTERGHCVRVLTAFPNYPGGKIYEGYSMRPHQREVINGIEIHRVPVFPSHDRSGGQRILTYGTFALSAAAAMPVVMRDVDVLYVYHPPGTIALPALVGRCVLKKNYVLHVQDMWPESITESGMIHSEQARRIVEYGVERLCGPMYRHADAIIAQSPGFERMLSERGAPRDRIEVIYNWADEARFFPVASDHHLAAALGLAGTFNVVYAGNLGPFQGLDVAIEAARLVQHLADFRLVLIGTGQSESDLRTRASGLSSVSFVDRIPYDQMNGVYQLADSLLVSLQDREFFRGTIPSKTQLSLAVGRPIVAAIAGDAADLLESTDAAHVCRPGEPEDMARAFESMYHMSRGDRERMGRRGREFYERKLALRVGAERLERALALAASRSPTRAQALGRSESRLDRGNAGVAR